MSWHFMDHWPIPSTDHLWWIWSSPYSKISTCEKMKEHFQRIRALNLLRLPNQGKVMECVAEDPASSHFLFSGSYTSFSDWWFMHKARLNQLPLNAARPWVWDAEQQEILLHILNHCMAYSAASQLRHNALLKRVNEAAASKMEHLLCEYQLGLNWTLSWPCPLQRRYCSTTRHLYPFDNHRDSFDQSREAKRFYCIPVECYLRTMDTLINCCATSPTCDFWEHSSPWRWLRNLFTCLCLES